MCLTHEELRDIHYSRSENRIDIPRRRARADVDAIDAKLSALQQERKEIIAEIQAQCQHPIDALIEGQYQSTYYSTTPPFRVCKLCGYAEEGWYCGYWKLQGNDIPQLPNEVAHKLVLKFYTQEKMNELRFQRKKS